jgi:hypothetical protein
LYPIGYGRQARARKCPYLNTNLALEINRLYDRRGAVWGSRYKAILVSQEEAARPAGSGTSSLTASRRGSWLMPGSGQASTAYRQQVAALVEQIESEAAAELTKSGRAPLGVAGVLRQSPETRPVRSKKSPAPLYHAATRAVRKAFWEAYCLFVSAFRDASERLRAGDRMARFLWDRFLRGCLSSPRMPLARHSDRQSGA